MQYRSLGDSDLHVSVIGLGTLSIAGAYGRVNDADSIATIKRAIDLGVNFIDTSDNYGFGHAEEVVGKAVEGRRDELVLATKGGTPWDAQKRVTNDCRPEVMTKAVEASLKRLGTGWIDLYQIHLPDPETPFEKTARVLERLIKAGKIRYIGLSNFWTDDLKAWIEIGEVVANQMPYNFLHRDIEESMLSFCRANGIGMIAYTPLCMGLFAGKIATDTRFDEGDHRSRYPQFQGEPLNQALGLIDRMRPIAEEHGLTLAQLALRWVISRPGVTCAISGAKRPARLEENVVAGEQFFSKAELAQIDRILEEARVETPRLMPMPVTEVRQGPRGKIGVLAMGIKVPISESIKAGDTVLMDAITGKVASEKEETA